MFKNKLETLFCIIIVSAIISCSKEQALINKIEGIYKIEKVAYMVSSGDSVATFSNSTMFFSECKLKDQTAQQCAGYFEVEGKSRMTFDYLPDRSSGKEVMNINSFDFDSKPYFGGSYIIEDREDNSLTLVRQRNYHSDKSDLRIYLKR
jgi:hypothetical protein